MRKLQASLSAPKKGAFDYWFQWCISICFARQNLMKQEMHFRHLEQRRKAILVPSKIFIVFLLLHQ